METAKSWWKSMAVQGGIVSFITMLSFFFELDLGDQEATLVAQGILGAIGIIMTIYGRIRAKSFIK